MACSDAQFKLDLTGQIALVTGAGVRLGREIALNLAECGSDVVLHARKSKNEAGEVAKQIRALGRRATVLTADLAKAHETLKLARAAEKAFGHIDILINSAAIFWATPLKKQNVKELDAFLDINLKNPYILTSEIGQRMKMRGKGAIVNMACVSAFRPWRTHVPYSISKAGVVAMTVGMSKLLAPEVRVNAIAPGTVLPPDEMEPADIEAIRERLPLKKIGTPSDILGAIRYLLGAGFVTGQVLCVDGGRSVI